MSVEAGALKGIVNLFARKKLAQTKFITKIHEEFPCYGLSKIFTVEYQN